MFKVMLSVESEDGVLVSRIAEILRGLAADMRAENVVTFLTVTASASEEEVEKNS